MNFISAFNELDKLYEETTPKVVLKKVDDLCTVMLDKRAVFTGTKQECNDFVKKQSNTEVAKRKKFEIVQGAEVPVIKEACVKESDDKTNSTEQGLMKDKDTDTVTFGPTQEPESSECTKTLPATNKLEEATEDEIPVDEEPVEEAPADEEVDIEVVDDENRQVICECDKCGALVIKDEADIVVDEETDLVNVEDECQFCEEAKGFKIIGVVAPYEVAEEPAPVEEIPAEEV